MKKLLLGVALVAASILGLTGTAQAATKSSSPYLPDNSKPGTTQYVRLKKTMDVGFYQKSNGHYKKLLKKKGSLLEVMGINRNEVNGEYVPTIGLTSGAVHYNRAKKLKYSTMDNMHAKLIPYTKANFKPVKLKAPDRTLLFQSGTGFKLNAKKDNLVTTPAFYLTLDNYLQYYNAADLAKVAPSGLYKNVRGMNVWKPTASVKVSKVSVKGRTTTVDYKKPLKGMPNKKISKGHYRLKIVHNTKKHHATFFPDGYTEEATWTTYKVNGKSYYVGESIEVKDYLDE